MCCSRLVKVALAIPPVMSHPRWAGTFAPPHAYYAYDATSSILSSGMRSRRARGPLCVGSRGGTATARSTDQLSRALQGERGSARRPDRAARPPRALSRPHVLRREARRRVLDRGETKGTWDYLQSPVRHCRLLGTHALPARKGGQAGRRGCVLHLAGAHCRSAVPARTRDGRRKRVLAATAITAHRLVEVHYPGCGACQ
jgi:hypothetical protein